MKRLKFLLGFLIIAGCSGSEFCGKHSEESDKLFIESFPTKLKVQSLDVAMKIVLSIGKKYGDEIKPKVEIVYSSDDTIACNILEIPSEEVAKQISCIVINEESIKPYKAAYFMLYWDNGSKLIIK